MRDRRTTWADIVTYVAAGAMIGGAAAVLLGWHIGSDFLVRFSPALAPMQYNISVGFLLLGLGVIAYVVGWRVGAAACASVVFLLGGATLGEYATGLSFGIDQILVDQSHYPSSYPPGRMSPNTALSMILYAVPLGLVCLRPQRIFEIFIGMLIIGMILYPVVSTLSGPELEYGWGHPTFVAITTPLGFILASLAFWGVAMRYQGASPDENIPLKRSLLTFFIVASSALVLWQALRIRDQTLAGPGSPLPLVVLISGLTLALLLSAVLYFFFLSRRQAALLAAANERLEGLVELRTEELIQAEKLAVVGQLASGVAHEINNPAAYVLTNLHALQKIAEALETTRHSPDRAAAQVVQYIGDLRDIAADGIHGMERIKATVQDLRLFSRQDDDAPEIVPVTDLCDSVANLAAAEVRRKATLNKDYQYTGAVRAVKGRMAQALLNLVVNAAEALPEGQPTAQTITLRTRQSDDEIVLEVVDTGRGIAPDVLPHIFDPFFTTQDVGKATGLGLSISKDIVARQNGTITIESEVGAGTTVAVHLPRVEDAALPAEPESRTPARGPGVKPRLLLVDDEPGIVTALKRILAARYHVVTAGTGREALDIIQADGAPVDVILCDIMMPDMNGMELYAALTGDDPAWEARMVFLTGGATNPATRDFIEEHLDRCLEKPITPPVLLDKLAALFPAA